MLCSVRVRLRCAALSARAIAAASEPGPTFRRCTTNAAVIPDCQAIGIQLQLNELRHSSVRNGSIARGEVGLALRMEALDV